MKALLLAIAMAAVLALGTTIDDHSMEQAQADDLQAAQRQAKAERTYQAAVQRLCGPNAAWMQLEGDAIQCTTKRGTPTTRLTLLTTTSEVTP